MIGIVYGGHEQNWWGRVTSWYFNGVEDASNFIFFSFPRTGGQEPDNNNRETRQMIDWPIFGQYVFLGAMGAASVEWLKAYELSGKKEQEAYVAMLKSPIYWFKFVLFIFASGFVAWAMHVNAEEPNLLYIVLTGMAASALANKGVEAVLSRGQAHAGVSNTGTPDIGTPNTSGPNISRLKPNVPNAGVKNNKPSVRDLF
uniref:Uncharacterized protein n=1 Tax=Candidatus Kentrum sp. FM TaxID=2126340 RepID=A0A450SSF3_9GAMM|nr:MAG: hypothetical protein BECKFM1743A_GA0114220_101754 [Candidatus Kentron sp. FM]VFJ56884.1 MAG: hypothetical protein BECKFM1743C_GA0114222_101874 [Candidatus Kentron sp. FM]VFK11498.1 MAG: hypothetical protein BECKFM1743B_GA0114221_101864 [Candidatus Kentron sp. FM]